MANICGTKSAVIQGGDKTARIQGISSFTPASISDLIAWYDAAIMPPGNLNLGNVSQWDDQSGNGNNLVQATAADQPEYVTSGVTPYLEFDGVSEFMSLSSFAGGNLSQPITIILTLKIQTIGNAKVHTGTGSGQPELLLRIPTDWGMYAGVALLLGGTPIDSSIITLVTIWDSPSSRLYQDGGSADINGDVGSTGLNGFYLGSTWLGTELTHMRAHEAMIYDKLLSTDELNQVGNYLANKHSLTWSDI